MSRQLVRFEKEGGNLLIVPTAAGRDELAAGEIRANDPGFFDLIEHQLQNGWELIDPGEIGALTDALIISDECERDDYGDLVRCGRVYSNIDYYQIESDVERLMRDGELLWLGHDENPYSQPRRYRGYAGVIGFRRQAIVTHFIGPTNSRGSRVKATAAAGSITVPWDHAMSSEQNHDFAALALAKKLGWDDEDFIPGGLPGHDGNVYVIAPKEH